MISILMPIYNGIEFLEQSLNSVLSQTFKDWELIIGINGHEKNSSIYQKAIHLSKDSRIKVHDMPGVSGKSAALNEMVNFCNYEILCLLDVDDVWCPQKLEKQIPLKDEFDVISTDCVYFGERSGKPNIINQSFRGGEVSKELIFSCNVIINSSSMFNKKDAYWDGNFESIEDYDMWLRLCSEGKKLYVIPEVLVKHRIHKDSFFNSKHQNLDSLMDKWK